jgi:hypothetical protein
MAKIRRVKPTEARHKVQSEEALFVCAYESEKMCDRMRLDGALTLSELSSRLPGIAKDEEIIFYCK